MFWRLCETGLKQGLEISQTVRSTPIFFFNFGLNRPFRPIQPIQAYSGPSRPDSGRISPCQSRVGSRRRKARGIHVVGHGWTRGQRRPLRVAVSDAGAAPLVPRPCFIVHYTICNIIAHTTINKKFLFLIFCFFKT